MSKNCKIIVSLIMAIALFIPFYNPVLANELDQKEEELEQERDQLEDGIEQRRQETQQLETEITQISEKIRQLDSQLQQQRQRINQLNSDISSTEVEIEKTEVEIAETEEFLEETTGHLETRLVTMYQRGSVGYIEVLLSATSFSEFLSRFNALRTIAEDDRRLVEEIKEKRNFLEVEREKQVERKESLVSMRAEAQAAEQQIQANRREQDSLSAKLHEKQSFTQARIAAKERAAKEVEKQIEEIIRRRQQQNVGNATGSFMWPVQDYGYGWVTSPYGVRVHPITGVRTPHRGIDVGIPRSRWAGSPNFNGNPVNVMAADGGVVVFAGGNRSTGYGLYVIVDHGGGKTTLYAHLHNILVSEGQQVAKGEPIGHVGSTGASTGPHLHYEIRVNGQHTNPMNYY
ncbi:peptidoglycan DD-metalloendopeptidase family protein [Proteinivorax hydrogeniformans]|uniref:Peptidoglycan DD-metalloendopeptidase family protein n=1 Tax=Proteinivorax hydrogeniformans TaxID=1826727 RepID=A0AAU8HV14_9FIRM